MADRRRDPPGSEPEGSTDGDRAAAAPGTRWWLNSALARRAFADTGTQSTLHQATGDDEPSPLEAPDDFELDLHDGTQREFGDFELREVIGRGGMGRVYRAYQRSLDREVALKLLSAGLWASPEFVDTLRREARHAAALHHPNIVAVYEIGEYHGLIYYAMQLVHGHSLAERLERDGPLPVREAARLLRTVAEAVDYAHHLGTLHLDLKPGNVMLDADGAPRITDFGLARQMGRDGSLDNDRLSGTPSYMAPEQVHLGRGQLSVATDIWGLGALLYELLTGHPPFEAGTPRATTDLVIGGRVRSPRRYRRELPRDLEAICLHCLRKRPIERYISARAVADDLGRFLEGRQVRVRPLNTWQRAWRWASREPQVATASILVLIVLGAGAVSTTRQRLRADANALRAHHHLWEQRHEAAWRLFEESRGYAALSRLASNLSEQESMLGAAAAATRERLRLGIAQAQMPALLDAIDVGAPVHVLALSPDGRSVALGLHPNRVALYDLATGQQRWRVELKTHTPAMDGQLRRLQFTPDRRFLLVSEHWQMQQIRPAGYQTYRLAVADGKQTMVPDAAHVGSESWSDDGRHVVLVDEAGSRFRLYRAEGWQPQSPWMPARLNQFRPGWLIAPGLEFIAMHYAPGGVEILDPRTLQARHALRPDRIEDRFIAWAISPDARWLALGRISGEVLLVDPASGAQQPLDSPGGEPTWLSFSADGRRLAASTREGQLHVFEVPGSTTSAAEDDAAKALYRLHREGEIWGHQLECDVVADSCTALVMAWDRVTLWSFAGHGDAVADPVLLAPEISHHSFVPRFASAIDQRRRLLATGGKDGSLRLWRLPATPQLTPLAPTLRETPLHFDGAHLVAVDGHDVWVFDAASGATRSPRLRLPQPVGFAALAADGRSIVVSSGRELHVFDWRSGRRRFPPIALDDSPLALLLGPDGRRAVSAGVSRQHPGPAGRLQVHDLTTGRALGPAVDMPFHGGEISADGRHLLVFAGQGSALYALDDLRHPLRRFPARSDEFEIGYATLDAAHGELVQYAESRAFGVDNRLQRWSLADGALLQDLPLTARAENLLVRSEDGRTALSGNPGGTATSDVALLLDRDGGRVQVGVTRQDRLARAQAFSADGRLLAQALASGVMLIDADNGSALGPPLRFALPMPDHVAQLAFSPDGRRLVARTALGRWLAWHLLPEARPHRVVAAETDLTAPLPSTAFTTPAAPLRASLRQRDLLAAGPKPPPRPSPWSCLSPDGVIPPRVAGTPARLLDLGARYTAPLHQVQLSTASAQHAGLGDLCTLPLGVQRLRGVDYDVRGVVELHHRESVDPAVTDGSGRPGPQRLRIAVEQGRYAGLHVLGALGSRAASDAGEVARLTWSYRDGSSAELPFHTGVSDWSGGSGQPSPDVGLAWFGAYPETEGTPFAKALLYATQMRNPHPQRELVALELRTTAPLTMDGGLVVVAITLDPLVPPSH